MKKTIYALIIMGMSFGSTLIAMYPEVPAIGPMAQQLRNAVTTGNLERVKALLQQGANVNTKNSAGRSVLILAARRSTKNNPRRDAYYGIVKALLAAGATPTTQKVEGVPWGHQEKVEQAEQADPRTRALIESYEEAGETGRPVRDIRLVFAAEGARVDEVRELLAEGANPTVGEPQHGIPIIALAARHSNPHDPEHDKYYEIVLLLLEKTHERGLMTELAGARLLEAAKNADERTLNLIREYVRQ